MREKLRNLQKTGRTAMNEQAKHTAGAIKAAEIITGNLYGSKNRVPTANGSKTTVGVADIIDVNTGLARNRLDQLVQACKAGRNAIVFQMNGEPAHPFGHRENSLMSKTLRTLQAALDAAEEL